MKMVNIKLKGVNLFIVDGSGKTSYFKSDALNFSNTKQAKMWFKLLKEVVRY